MKKVQIASATLYLADAREVVLDGGSVDMIFTDPPYGHKNNDTDLIANWEKVFNRRFHFGRSQNTTRPIMNDGKEADDLGQWLFKQASDVLTTGGGICCCCGGGGPDPQFARWSLWMDQYLDFMQAIVWDKGPMGLGHYYRRSYEMVLVARKKGNTRLKWYDTSNQIENVIRPGQYGIRKIIPRENQHPTIKPVELAAHFIQLHTKKNDVVYDPFMGEGTTGVAALSLGRKFVGVEMDECWFDKACISVEKASSGLFAPTKRDHPNRPDPLFYSSRKQKQHAKVRKETEGED